MTRLLSARTAARHDRFIATTGLHTPALRSDLGLLAAEYNPRARHMRGNVPQARTHMALIHTARPLSISEQQARRASEKDKLAGRGDTSM